MRLKGLVCTILLCALFGISGIGRSQEDARGPILQRIYADKTLRCGVNFELPGFGSGTANRDIPFPDRQFEDEPQGFEIDICHAVAAALSTVNNPITVTFVPLLGGERAAAIQSQDGQLPAVDLIVRSVSLTLSRDTSWNVIYGPILYYDEQGFMANRTYGITNTQLMSGITTCVPEGTTSYQNVIDAFSPMKACIVQRDETSPACVGTDYNLRLFNGFRPIFDNIREGTSGMCMVGTSDLSQLYSMLSLADKTEITLVPDSINPVTIGLEPLAPISPEIDPAFADIVTWTVYGLIRAEELNISQTSYNADCQWQQNEARPLTQTQQRFLGIGSVEVGEFLGLRRDFMNQVICKVGNYGEIYNRHIVPLGLARSEQNLPFSSGGLLYAPPFP